MHRHAEVRSRHTLQTQVDETDRRTDTLISTHEGILSSRDSEDAVDAISALAGARVVACVAFHDVAQGTKEAGERSNGQDGDPELRLNSLVLANGSPDSCRAGLDMQQ